MSKAHLYHSPDGLVVKCLRGIISYNPSLSLDEAHRVVFDTDHDPSQVSLVSGGGSGHEPAWAGYVGENMLAAAVAGDIFASPSARQILAAIEAVPSDEGCILVVTNYTGDCLHFGLASEKAAARGRRCRVVICGDDVSVGRGGSGSGLVGRRGLAGQMAVLKVMGGAAGGQGGGGASLDDVYDLGVALSRQIVSLAATLDHCHVPGRPAEHTDAAGALGGDDEGGGGGVVEIGTGPHNEPGYARLSPAPSAADLVRRMLAWCLDERDPERAYVRFRRPGGQEGEGDEDETTMLLLCNYGGISPLEMGALADEVLGQLAADWGIEPARVYVGPIETSLNAPAFSVSVVNVTAAAEGCAYSAEQILAFADARTTTCWESMAGRQGERNNHGRRRRRREEQFVTLPAEPPSCQKKAATAADDAAREDDDPLRVDPATLDRMLRGACGALVAAEPDLTRWDTVMGDGDCGATLKTGATGLLAALDGEEGEEGEEGLGLGLAAAGSVVAVLRALEDIVESRMGGTLGGILGIFFVALRNAVESDVAGASASPSPRGAAAAAEIWGRSLAAALGQLSRYTPAKVGDRTVMDTLIPFAEAILKEGSLEEGVRAAVRGAEATQTMAPRLGRATYVAAGREDDGQLLPPDPGAWGAMVAIRGLREGLADV